MVQQDWAKSVQAAMEHLEKGKRVYPVADSLTVIDDIVDGLSPNAIAMKNGFSSDLISTALGHVTTAVHGPGKVPCLADGGWYERQNDAYAVAPGFASALEEIPAFMNQVVIVDYYAPAIVTAEGERATTRFLEFFASHIRNPNTRRAYGRGLADFLAWCEGRGVASIAAVQPLHVAAYVELLTRELAAPTVKQRLAAIRMLFDWLVVGQVVPVNPAASVRGPSHSVRRGKTPVLDPAEARQLLDAIDVTTPIGLRDRALIGLMVYSFARVGAALGMKVGDVYVQNRRLWVRLHEKGGKRHEMPCHHNLEAYLHAYIDGAGLGDDPKGPLFRTIGRGTSRLTANPLAQADAYQMIRRRAEAAEIATKIGNHTFRATGITAYLKNGGTIEKAAAMANHASTRTTQLYDRRSDEVTLDEVERVLI